MALGCNIVSSTMHQCIKKIFFDMDNYTETPVTNKGQITEKSHT